MHPHRKTTSPAEKKSEKKNIDLKKHDFLEIRGYPEILEKTMIFENETGPPVDAPTHPGTIDVPGVVGQRLRTKTNCSGADFSDAFTRRNKEIIRDLRLRRDLTGSTRKRGPQQSAIRRGLIVLLSTRNP